MRDNGSQPSLRPGEHMCLGFDDDRTLEAYVARLVEEGMDAHERLLLTGQTGSPVLVVADSMPSFIRMQRSGQASSHALEDLYLPDEALDPDQRIEGYRSAAEQARADGYTALRIIADATPLVTDLQDRMTFVGYEARVGRMISSMPLSAVCAYDTRVLGEEAVLDLASVHEVSEGTARPPFAIYGTPDRYRLSGEIDFTSLQRLSAALTGLGEEDLPLVLDFSGLSFIDVSSMHLVGSWVLEQRASGRELGVENVSDLTRWCWSTMSLDI